MWLWVAGGGLGCGGLGVGGSWVDGGGLMDGCLEGILKKRKYVEDLSPSRRGNLKRSA